MDLSLIGFIIFLVLTALTVWLWFRTKNLRVLTGDEAIRGDRGKALEDFLDGKGTVRMDGEIWEAVSYGSDVISRGDRVIILDRSDLVLKVQRDRSERNI